MPVQARQLHSLLQAQLLRNRGERGLRRGLLLQEALQAGHLHRMLPPRILQTVQQFSMPAQGGIVQKLRPFTRTTVAQVVAANPRISDPDVIKVGWRLRIPQRA